MIQVGIDGSNLHGGGGVTHLVELLGAADPDRDCFERVVVFGTTALLQRLPDRVWLKRAGHPWIEKSLTRRLLWKRLHLARSLRESGCDVLLVPGGGSGAGFRPFVAISQNILPFDPENSRRYRGTWMGLRMQLLTQAQTRTFRSADGMIFLTETARSYVERRTGPIRAPVRIIAHGVSNRFRAAPRDQRPIAAYSPERPFRLLYVSIIDLYKHQWVVAEAVARLRAAKVPVALDLVGPAYPPALKRLRETLQCVDPDSRFVHYRQAIAHGELDAVYHQADAFVFASSCENLPNVLVEAMAAGLPIACSNRGVMPEVLGDSGVYFDPEDVTSVTSALQALVTDAELRRTLACAAAERAAQFTWERCARETFAFLHEVAHARTARPRAPWASATRAS